MSPTERSRGEIVFSLWVAYLFFLTSMSYSRVTRHENRNFRFGFQQPHAILEFLFVKPEEPHLSILGSGISVQNCSCWQKITSEPGFATRAADTADTAASLAPLSVVSIFQAFRLVPRQNYARSQNQRLGGAPARRALRYGHLLFVLLGHLLGCVISVFRSQEELLLVKLAPRQQVLALHPA